LRRFKKIIDHKVTSTWQDLKGIVAGTYVEGAPSGNGGSFTSSSFCGPEFYSLGNSVSELNGSGELQYRDIEVKVVLGKSRILLEGSNLDGGSTGFKTVCSVTDGD